MTAEPTEQEPTGHQDGVLVFTTPKSDPGTAVVQFQLDDDPEVLTALRPKKAKLVKLIGGMGKLDEVDNLQAAGILDDLMRIVFDADTVAYFDARFDDDDDDCDLDVLEPILTQLIEVWFPGGPTGGRRGSSPTPPRTGPRSTVRSRSRR